MRFDMKEKPSHVNLFFWFLVRKPKIWLHVTVCSVICVCVCVCLGCSRIEIGIHVFRHGAYRNDKYHQNKVTYTTYGLFTKFSESGTGHYSSHSTSTEQPSTYIHYIQLSKITKLIFVTFCSYVSPRIFLHLSQVSSLLYML